MVRLVALVAFLLGILGLSLAQEEDVLIKTPLTKKLPDMNVSLGIISIEELKRSFPRAYSLLEKHHGSPTKYDTHHLAVALWREEGDRVTYLSNYRVEAEVRSPLLRAQRKDLHKYPHQHGDNFGGWFQMAEKGLYSVNVYIRDEKGKVRKLNFDYLLQ
ncbi:MAG: hypothetical protein D6674_02555 [Acidobacteria bacterium]|nr:MAG: hypothetical protein D6674_02555 [Acidobacteriota bacterium]